MLLHPDSKSHLDDGRARSACYIVSTIPNKNYKLLDKDMLGEDTILVAGYAVTLSYNGGKFVFHNSAMRVEEKPSGEHASPKPKDRVPKWTIISLDRARLKGFETRLAHV